MQAGSTRCAVSAARVGTIVPGGAAPKAGPSPQNGADSGGEGLDRLTRGVSAVYWWFVGGVCAPGARHRG